MLTFDDIQQRWVYSYEAKSHEDSKYILISQALQKYERHLLEGDDKFGQSFRFPELQGYVNRKFQNAIDVLPETRVTGKTWNTVVMQGAMDTVKRKGNFAKAQKDAIKDAIGYGACGFYLAPVQNIKYTKDGKKYTQYFGMGFEKVDYRDMYPAYSANNMHDHTGIDCCPFLFRRRIYYYDTFMRMFKGGEYLDQPFKNIDKVAPVTYSQAMMGASRTPTENESREKEQGKYVQVLEYWDQENDEFMMFANFIDEDGCIYQSPKGIPFSHKQIPYHIFYNLKRHDSIHGISEVELNMPYHHFRERVLNLAIEDATLSLQPAYITSGNVDLNPDEHPLQPGAQWNLGGLVAGKLQDNIMEFRAGGVPGDFYNMLEVIENSRITVTGDDTTALYANPNQLATQTLAKREALQKVIRTMVTNNTLDTQYYIDQQIASFVSNELAQPYKDAEGKTKYFYANISGFSIKQTRDDDKIAEMVKMESGTGTFALNEKVAKGFNDLDIEVVSARLDDEIKRDRNEKMLMLINQMLTVAQTNPQILQDIGLNLGSFLKQYAKNLGMDLKEIFPEANFSKNKSDVLTREYEVIALGIVPKVQSDMYDLLQRYQDTIEFTNTKIYKEFSKSSKDAFSKFQQNILTTLRNEYMEEAAPEADERGGAVPNGSSQQEGVAGPIQTGVQQPDAGRRILPEQEM